MEGCYVNRKTATGGLQANEIRKEFKGWDYLQVYIYQGGEVYSRKMMDGCEWRKLVYDIF